MTTTTINDISDLARILAERPEWSDTLRSLLLTKEILDLPTALAQLTQVVNDFIQEQREINQRADERLARLEEIAASSNERLTRLEEIAARSEQRLTKLEEIAASTNERLTRLEEIAASTNERVTRTDERVSNLEADNRRIHGQLGRLLGAEAERRLQGHLDVVLSQRMRLRRAVTLKSIIANIDRGLADLLEDAEDQQIITPEQNIHVRLLDVILRAIDRATAAPVYIAVEISLTLHQEDIDRAAERAAILEKATGVAAKAVVVSGRVPPPQETQAAAAGVSIILVEDLARDAPED